MDEGKNMIVFMLMQVKIKSYGWELFCSDGFV